MSASQFLVVGLCTGAMVVDGYDIQVMALSVPALAQGWALPPSDFGLALSAVVIGISIGSGLLGPLGDRYGRRTMLIITMAAAGLVTCATALAASPRQFVVWRLLTGVMLGAGVPSCAALNSEYAPTAYRSLLMGVMNCGPPLGALGAGLIAPPLLAAMGWRGAFIVGGIAPLLIAALAFAAPESLKFLLARHRSGLQLKEALRKIAPNVDPSALRDRPSEQQARGSLLAPLQAPYFARTLLLWGLVGLNLFNLYVLISWLPTILQQSGWTLAGALRGAVLIQAGGVLGGLGMSRLLDRGATRLALLMGFSLSGVSLTLFSLLSGAGTWVALLLLIGAGLSGSQLSLNALSAAYYPPAIKATGVSWALVVGGMGSILGPLAGAWLIELRFSPVAIVGLLAIPSLLCALGAILLRREWQAH